MLEFYDISPSYVEYLKRFDSQVPNIIYTNVNKFVCGTVLRINSIEYYVPLSSNIHIYRTSFPIYSKDNRILATLRFSFMLPVPSSELTIKDFNFIRQKDPKYADLILEEWEYCNRNESKILAKAQSVYSIGCNKSHILNYTCCDFKVLEQAYRDHNALLVPS